VLVQLENLQETGEKVRKVKQKAKDKREWESTVHTDEWKENRIVIQSHTGRFLYNIAKPLKRQRVASIQIKIV
jgi:hypothetical protein